MQALDELLADRGLDEDGLLQCGGFDDACIGVVERCGFQPVLCYDADAIIAALIAQGIDADEARDIQAELAATLRRAGDFDRESEAMI